VTSLRHLVSLVAWSVVSGCASWHRVVPPADTTLAPRQQVEVWQGTRSSVLHAIRLTPDSLSGVPFHRPPTCDSCRVAVPRASIDSLRLGHRETAALFFTGLGIAAVVVILLNPPAWQ
jgi:hypothetical protein